MRSFIRLWTKCLQSEKCALLQIHDGDRLKWISSIIFGFLTDFSLKDFAFAAINFSSQNEFKICNFNSNCWSMHERMACSHVKSMALVDTISDHVSCGCRRFCQKRIKHIFASFDSLDSTSYVALMQRSVSNSSLTKCYLCVLPHSKSDVNTEICSNNSSLCSYSRLVSYMKWEIIAAHIFS